MEPVKEGESKPITTFEIKNGVHYYNGVPETFKERSLRINGYHIVTPQLAAFLYSPDKP